MLRPGAALFVAVEDGSRTQVRDYYLDRAQERGALPPTLGARTADVLVELERRGAQPVEIRANDLRWEHVWSAREVLTMLERRTFSLLWDLPDDIHTALLAQTREWTLRIFGTLDARERVEAQLVLYAARKPDGRQK